MTEPTKQNGTDQAKPTIVCEITITNHDIENLIAFGNRAQMSGLEGAAIWAPLRANLVAVLEQANAVPDDTALIVPDAELSPGGTD